MIELETECERRLGVTFVSATVTNTRSTAQSIHLRNRLDGPTWPPQCGDRPASEWCGDVWESVVEPGRTRGMGYASSAQPRNEPIEVCSVERAPTRHEHDGAAVLADLADWSPPAEILTRDE